MIRDSKIWIADDEKGENIFMLPNMSNRHGLVAGATGTGKTVTLKVMAEAFSDMGVPVFMADVKGDVAGLAAPGDDSESMQKRIEKFGLAEAGFSYHGYPVTIWDIFGSTGVPLRTTVSEMGPLLLSRVLNLNDLQTDIMNVIFKIADDNNLLLVDTKDLKALLNYVGEHSSELAAEYGKIQTSSIGAMTRAIVALEMEGGEVFFGETALNVADWLTPAADGRGMIHILDSSGLINNGRLYATFLLWLISELFENLPEVGDLEKPRLVFFFDEAHMLFDGTSKAMVDKLEQVIRLIRSKGVGIYFITQSPSDIPDAILGQLGNRIQHALRAYTPKDQKAVRVAAQSFRANPDFSTEQAIMELGTGEALVSVLDEKGAPTIVQCAKILFPLSQIGAITEGQRIDIQNAAPDHIKDYANYYDRESAYEVLIAQKEQEDAEAAEMLRQQEEAKQQKEAEKEAERLQKEQERQMREEEKEAERQRKAEAVEELRRQREQEKLEREAAREAERQRREAEREAERKRKEEERLAKEKAKSSGMWKRTIFGTLIGAVLGSVGHQVGTSVGKKITGNTSSTKKKTATTKKSSSSGSILGSAAKTAANTATRRVTNEILKNIFK